MTGSSMRKLSVFVGVLLMGFVGGLAGSRLLAPAPAVAEAMESPEPQELTVRKLTVVDDRGRERIFLRVRDDLPQVVLRDPELRPRVFIGHGPPARPDKPSHWQMYLIDAAGNPRTLCALQDDGGGASLQVRDNNGKTRFVVAFADDGNGGLVLRDTEGRKRFGIGMPPHAGYSMGFMDENGETIWSAPGQPMPEEPMQ